MNKKEIIEQITEAVKSILGNEHEVLHKEVKKNNGAKFQAIVLREKESNISVVIYTDQMIEAVANGEEDPKHIAEGIVETYMQHQECGWISKMLDSFKKEDVLKNVVYKVINYAENTDRIGDLPHKKFLDLAAVYKIDINNCTDERCSIEVNNKMCEKYSISLEELDAAAMKNTEEKGFVIQTMDSFVAEITDLAELLDDGRNMWILTNKEKYDGAAVLIYKKYFKDIACGIQKDLYILPSSIHEVIAVPAQGDLEELTKMVSVINNYAVKEDEVLGRNVYRYCRETGMIVNA